MKLALRLLGVAALIALGIVIYRAVRQYREDSVFDLGANPQSPPPSSSGGEPRSISPELLAILADPGDKGPVELMRDSEGKEWLVNRRNGYRYPVEDGIPVMLLEEGEKNRDESLIIRQE
ncbi:Trm112 family protein [Roseiflexus sp.]|uniref:Trm112 family protein n=1 Tax=Roseiflexus sp. TaxID=2562120 RepID=UPI00398B365E